MKRVRSDEEVVKFVCEASGANISPPYAALGVEKDGWLMGGVVFNEYNGSNVEVTVAGVTKAFTPTFIRRCFKYAFEELGCLRVSITTEKPEVVELALRLGAQTEGRKQNFYGPGRDAVLLGILKGHQKV